MMLRKDKTLTPDQLSVADKVLGKKNKDSAQDTNKGYNPYDHAPKKVKEGRLYEGLRSHDLKDMVSNRFTIDQYKSKMGNDEDIMVIAFKVKDKFPATDLMEFIEKGYLFVLDSAMSTGEENDGQYSVFVELERNRRVPDELDEILKDLSQLCDFDNWRFTYFKDIDSHQFSKESIKKFVPLDQDSYKLRIKEKKMTEVGDILNQGTVKVADIDESNNLILTKPFAGSLNLKLESLGFYTDVINQLPGAIQLDETSNSEILFLEKYLGNTDIYKINNKFLIKNGIKAIIVSRGS